MLFLFRTAIAGLPRLAKAVFFTARSHAFSLLARAPSGLLLAWPAALTLFGTAKTALLHVVHGAGRCFLYYRLLTARPGSSWRPGLLTAGRDGLSLFSLGAASPVILVLALLGIHGFLLETAQSAVRQRGNDAPSAGDAVSEGGALACRSEPEGARSPPALTNHWTKKNPPARASGFFSYN